MEEIMVKPSQHYSFNVRQHELYLAPVLKALVMLLIGRHGVFVSAEHENAHQRWKVPPEVADFILLAGYGPKTFDYQNSIKKSVVGAELALNPCLEQEIAALKGNLDEYAKLCSGAAQVLIPFPHGMMAVHRDFNFRPQKRPIDVLTCQTRHVKLDLLTSIFDETVFLKMVNTPLGFIKDVLYYNPFHPSCFDLDGIRYCQNTIDETGVYYLDGAVKYGKITARNFDRDAINGLIRAIEDDLPLTAALALQTRGD